MLLRLCLLILTILPVSACDAGSPPLWRGQADTLPDGRVLVRNPATPVWDSASSWTLVEQWRIGTVGGSGPELFSYVAALVVDSLRRVWVLDRNAKELRVFADDGSHVRTIGRLGGGPGEFRDPIGLALHPAGQVWVVDPGNARYAVFDTSGTYVTAHQRRITGYTVPWRGGFDDQGRLLEAGSARIPTESWARRALIRHDVRMAPVDTFFVPHYDEAVYELSTAQGVSMTANVPYAPTLVWSFDVNRGMWSGVNSEYRIYAHTFGGDTVRAISREHEALPVTRDERDTAIARMEWFTRQGGQVDASRIPSRKPAFERIDVAPDGHLWVSVTPATGMATPFDLFDPEGRYLGELRPPTTLRRVLFRGNDVYGLTQDSLDVTYVVKFRIAAPRADERAR